MKINTNITNNIYKYKVFIIIGLCCVFNLNNSLLVKKPTLNNNNNANTNNKVVLQLEFGQSCIPLQQQQIANANNQLNLVGNNQNQQPIQPVQVQQQVQPIMNNNNNANPNLTCGVGLTCHISLKHCVSLKSGPCRDNDDCDVNFTCTKVNVQAPITTKEHQLEKGLTQAVNQQTLQQTGIQVKENPVNNQGIKYIAKIGKCEANNRLK